MISAPERDSGLRLGEDYYGPRPSASPPRDTIPEARLRQGGYLQTLKNAGRRTAAHWPFAGGDTAIRTVADSVGFRYRYDKETQQYEHPAVSMVLGPTARSPGTSTA